MPTSNEHTVIKRMAEVFGVNKPKTSVTVTTTTSGAPRPTTVRNVMSAVGDLIRGGESGGPVRLPIGDEGEVLTVVDGKPNWEPSAGSSLPTGVEGDILYHNGSGWQKLAIGTVDQVLTVTEVTSGHFQPRWSDPVAIDLLFDNSDSIILDNSNSVVQAGP